MVDDISDTIIGITNLEKTLDFRVEVLADKVNSLYVSIRARNKKTLENYAKNVNLPLIGRLFYNYNFPELDKELPAYYNLEWYKSESQDIRKEAFRLEKMKSENMDSFGDEIVEISFDGDHAGYYNRNVPRKDAYKEYILEGKPETPYVNISKKHSLFDNSLFTKDKYAFDEATWKVVPEALCIRGWTDKLQGKNIWRQSTDGSFLHDQRYRVEHKGNTINVIERELKLVGNSLVYVD